MLSSHQLVTTTDNFNPEPGTSGSLCQGYRGAEGTCELLNCPTVQEDLNRLSITEFVSRHGPNCTFDQDGQKLICCPKKIETRGSCGKSTLGRNRQSGLAHHSSWPWFVVLYIEILGDDDIWSGCDGVLVSERHILTYYDCGYSSQYYAILGLFSEDASDIQRISIATSIVPISWSNTDGLAILLLKEKAVLKPNVVWPICLSLDPIADLGFKLDNLSATDKNLAMLPYWTRGPRKVLSQLQVLYLNCTAFPDYNYDLQKRLCATGLSTTECQTTGAAHGTPMVVESQVTEDVYLAGLTSSFFCSEKASLLDMIAITPFVEDIYNIIQA